MRRSVSASAAASKVKNMSKYVYIHTSGIESPKRAASPFFLATTAALMEHEAVMVFTITGTSLLQKGAAEDLYMKGEGNGSNLQFFIDQARDAGVKFYVCAPSLDLNDLAQEDLIEIDGIIGGSALNELCGQADVVLTF